MHEKSTAYPGAWVKGEAGRRYRCSAWLVNVCCAKPWAGRSACYLLHFTDDEMTIAVQPPTPQYQVSQQLPSSPSLHFMIYHYNHYLAYALNSLFLLPIYHIYLENTQLLWNSALHLQHACTWKADCGWRRNTHKDWVHYKVMIRLLRGPSVLCSHPTEFLHSLSYPSQASPPHRHGSFLFLTFRWSVYFLSHRKSRNNQRGPLLPSTTNFTTNLSSLLCTYSETILEFSPHSTTSLVISSLLGHCHQYANMLQYSLVSNKNFSSSSATPYIFL